VRKRVASLTSRARNSANSILNVLANRLDCPLTKLLNKLHVKS
jgi:hypothetical protein